MTHHDFRVSIRSDSFAHRHLGPRAADIEAMLETLGMSSLDELIERVIPADIRVDSELQLPRAKGEMQAIEEMRQFAAKNQVMRSYIGMGYHDCITPPVILRNILQNPGWYTQYTPYQAEISQGRLEALLIFQTMIIDLTGMEVANSSLLDEATAAAEAMTMCRRVLGRKALDRNEFFVAAGCHPQTIEVLRTRAEPLGIEIVVGEPASASLGDSVFGALLQYPDTYGSIEDLSPFVDRAHAAGALVTAGPSASRFRRSSATAR